MVNDLSEWIKKGQEKGYSIEQLREMLKKKGYSGEQIRKNLPERKFPKKIIIAVIIAIIIIASVLIYQKIVYFSILDSIEKENAACAERARLYCGALTADDIEFCEGDNACKDFYYFGNAVKSNDPGLCKSSNEPTNDMCKAYIQSNLSFCDMQGAKEECILIIQAKDNTALCDGIKNTPPRVLCKVLSSKDSSYCNLIEKDTCSVLYNSQLYALTKDKQYCENIQNEQFKNCCLSLENLKISKKCFADPVFYSCIGELNGIELCKEFEESFK